MGLFKKKIVKKTYDREHMNQLFVQAFVPGKK
mgnify:CR=1 FL=1